MSRGSGQTSWVLNLGEDKDCCSPFLERIGLLNVQRPNEAVTQWGLGSPLRPLLHSALSRSQYSTVYTVHLPFLSGLRLNYVRIEVYRVFWEVSTVYRDEQICQRGAKWLSRCSFE